jgi:transcription elongation factor GreA
VSEDQNISLGDASGKYLASLKTGKMQASQPEVGKFVRWFGKERAFKGVTPAEVESYGGRVSGPESDYLERLGLVRAFLAYSHKQGWTEANLGAHLKARRGKTKSRQAGKKEAPETVRLTEQGHAELKSQLASLEDERVHLTAEVRRAAADKDFRENAPLHAAREKKGHVEGKIRELEGILKVAVVMDEKQGVGHRVSLGDSVVICEVDSDKEICYKLVTTKEVDVTKGKISSVSPLGQAIMGRKPGDVVEIAAPVGKLRYRIVRIDR